MPDTTTKKTIILFSGELDKALAAFTIANGAAAMGDEVTIFCTFWGLNVLRKPQKVKTGGRTLLQTMFVKMMPRGSKKFGLSKMNFAGLGAPLMRLAMKQQNVMSLEEQIATAKELGVKLIACTMTMDMMGLRKEELFDDVEYAGVASYLSMADEASINLFI